MDHRPTIRGISETVLYCDDLAESRAFFLEILGLPLIQESGDMLVFDAGTAQVLLIFRRGPSKTDKPIGDSFIPGHQADGPAHMAFHVSIGEYDAWKAWFSDNDIAVISEVSWPLGGRSIYFNDPAGNVLELETPGVWPSF